MSLAASYRWVDEIKTNEEFLKAAAGCTQLYIDCNRTINRTYLNKIDVGMRYRGSRDLINTEFLLDTLHGVIDQIESDWADRIEDQE